MADRTLPRTPKLKLVAYLRVSTESQVERGFGLEVQEDAIRQWAKAGGHRIVAWYRDEGVSGSNGVESREALPDILRAIHDGEADGVVVARLDRLARDLVIQEQLLAELWRLGAQVFSTSDGESSHLTDDPGDPSRKLIRQILGAVAEYERALIKLRLSAGRKRKAQGGGYAYGAPPYGWRSDDGELVEVPEEQEAIALMRSLRDDGAILREIADELERRGIAPRMKRRAGAATTGRWDPKTISRILERETA